MKARRDRASPRPAFARLVVVSVLGLSLGDCAARGHLATPADLSELKAARGLSASGKLSLSGPRGRFSTRVVFGVAPPDSLRIEIPSGAGLRFLLVAHGEKLRAELPEDDATFEGPATSATMKNLFGVDLSPRDLVQSLLGQPPPDVRATWRFNRGIPVQVTLRKSDEAELTIGLDDPQIDEPQASAFQSGAARKNVWTLSQMSERLGLVR